MFMLSQKKLLKKIPYYHRNLRKVERNRTRDKKKSPKYLKLSTMDKTKSSQLLIVNFCVSLIKFLKLIMKWGLRVSE